MRLALSDTQARGVEKARTLGYLASIGLRLIETSTLERRLETMEEVLQAGRRLEAGCSEATFFG